MAKTAKNRAQTRFEGIILAMLLLQVLFTGRSALQTLRTAGQVRGLSNAQRRLRMWPAFFQQLDTIEGVVPKDARIRWVSRHAPWYEAYYLYPRLLWRGADPAQTVEAVRRQFPSDWVLGLSNENHLHFSIFEPMRASQEHRR